MAERVSPFHPPCAPQKVTSWVTSSDTNIPCVSLRRWMVVYSNEYPYMNTYDHIRICPHRPVSRGRVLLKNHLLHLHLYWMLRYRIISCTCAYTWRYATGHVFHVHLYLMLRYRIMSSTCTCLTCPDWSWKILVSRGWVGLTVPPSL